MSNPDAEEVVDVMVRYVETLLSQAILSFSTLEDALETAQDGSKRRDAASDSFLLEY